MHNRLFEIRNGKPFTEEEIAMGIAPIEDCFDALHATGADYIVPSEFSRESDLEFLDNLPYGVLVRNGEKLSFSQSAYDNYVEGYVNKIKALAAEITPYNFYPTKSTSLIRLAEFRPIFADTYVYDVDSEELMPIFEFLMASGEYLDKCRNRAFYVGKIYDVHW